MDTMKPFAIYFPQFYSIPINDDAWGRGFTDWALVANANLRNQWPRRAPQAGFYNGASREVHLGHIREASAAGLGGFGVYHYWFFTQQELGAFETTLRQSPMPSLPWFLIWASESWSKRWLADPTPLISLVREPSSDQIAAHCDHLAACFAQSNYLRWRGKPLFVWYDLGHFLKPQALVERYRTMLSQRGFDVALAHFVKSPFDLDYCAFTDACYLFEPRLYFGLQTKTRGRKSKAVLDLARATVGSAGAEKLLVTMDKFKKTACTFAAADYLAYMRSPERAALLKDVDKPLQEVVSPGWNNTPRYGARFTALEPLQPADFGQLVREAAARSDLPALINAWNEWSEGAAIEPCAYLGRRYLDAIGGG